MKLVSLGPLKVYASGGSDQDGGGDGPAVVLCHGFGAPGDDLVPLQSILNTVPRLRCFFPEAPLEVDLGMGASGRAWWPLDLLKIQRLIMQGQRTMTAEYPEGMARATDALSECLTKLQSTYRLDPSRMVIGGFSQGAMMMTEIALHATVPFAGLAILSGTLLCEDRWQAAATRHASGMQVFQSHGRSDPILQYTEAEKLRTLLTDRGATVQFHPFAGQHELPLSVLRALGAFLQARLGST